MTVAVTARMWVDYVPLADAGDATREMISKKSGVIVFALGEHHTAMILSCDSPISPSNPGYIELVFFWAEKDVALVKRGLVVELRDNPNITFANAKVEAVRSIEQI